VLIDPSYETKSDYTSVIKALQEALRRFPTGTYALWYPMLAKLESRQLPDACARSARNWLHATLEVKAPAGTVSA
jgi:23S rRNA (adenine2030-N6)-methyltransferase